MGTFLYPKHLVGEMRFEYIILSLAIGIILVSIIIYLFIKKSSKKANNNPKKDVQIKKTMEKQLNKAETPEKRVDLLNQKVRSFLSQKYNLDINLDYSEYISFFTKKNKTLEKKLCEKMTELLYSGKPLEESNINNISAALQLLMLERVKKVSNNTKTKEINFKDKKAHRFIHSIDSKDRIKEKLKRIKDKR